MAPGLGCRAWRWHAVAHPEPPSCANSLPAALCGPAIGGHTHNSIPSAMSSSLCGACACLVDCHPLACTPSYHRDHLCSVPSDRLPATRNLTSISSAAAVLHACRPPDPRAATLLTRGSLLAGRSPLLATLASAPKTLALSVCARALNPGC
jgi:hypothetical protein